MLSQYIYLQGKGIAILVQQLCSLAVLTVCHACCVVANLAACNQVHFHDALMEGGALSPLVELLRCSLDEQAAALGALRNLTSDPVWQVCPNLTTPSSLRQDFSGDQVAC